MSLSARYYSFTFVLPISKSWFHTIPIQQLPISKSKAFSNSRAKFNIYHQHSTQHDFISRVLLTLHVLPISKSNAFSYLRAKFNTELDTLENYHKYFTNDILQFTVGYFKVKHTSATGKNLSLNSWYSPCFIKIVKEDKSTWKSNYFLEIIPNKYFLEDGFILYARNFNINLHKQLKSLETFWHIVNLLSPIWERETCTSVCIFWRSGGYLSNKPHVISHMVPCFGISLHTTTFIL